MESSTDRGGEMIDMDRVVLKREVEMSDVRTVAYANNWRMKTITREGDSPIRKVWASRRGDTSITFLEDPYVELRYVVVEGPETSDISRVLRSSLPCWNVEESMRLLLGARDADEMIHAIYLTAVGAPSEESIEIMNAFISLSRNDDPVIRRAILVAMNYIGNWPSARDLVEGIYNNDSDEMVRRDAGYLLEWWSRK